MKELNKAAAIKEELRAEQEKSKEIKRSEE
jgi:hypothetical protein